MFCPPRHRGVQVEPQAIALSVEPGGRIGQGAVDRRIATRHECLVSVDIEGDLGGLRAGSGIHAEAVGSDAVHLSGEGWLYRNAPTVSARCRAGRSSRPRTPRPVSTPTPVTPAGTLPRTDGPAARGRCPPAASSDGVFSNLSHFHTTSDENAYDRAVENVLDAPSSLGAVVDTSRDRNGAPADGKWWDPAGRKIGGSRR